MSATQRTYKWDGAVRITLDGHMYTCPYELGREAMSEYEEECRKQTDKPEGIVENDPEQTFMDACKSLLDDHGFNKLLPDLLKITDQQRDTPLDRRSSRRDFLLGCILQKKKEISHTQMASIVKRFA